MSADDARVALRRCCGSQAWADAMVHARPFEDVPAVLRIGERTWWSLGEVDHREAFAAHPKIGEAKVPASGDATWSTDEQRLTAQAEAKTLARLAEANRAYEAKLGFIFIVCASGRSAEAMLADLDRRLGNAPAEELRTAAEEQAAFEDYYLGHRHFLRLGRRYGLQHLLKDPAARGRAAAAERDVRRESPAFRREAQGGQQRVRELDPHNLHTTAAADRGAPASSTQPARQ